MSWPVRSHTARNHRINVLHWQGWWAWKTTVTAKKGNMGTFGWRHWACRWGCFKRLRAQRPRARARTMGKMPTQGWAKCLVKHEATRSSVLCACRKGLGDLIAQEENSKWPESFGIHIPLHISWHWRECELSTREQRCSPCNRGKYQRTPRVSARFTSMNFHKSKDHRVHFTKTKSKLWGDGLTWVRPSWQLVNFR